jgi:hypothetical protein
MTAVAVVRRRLRSPGAAPATAIAGGAAAVAAAAAASGNLGPALVLAALAGGVLLLHAPRAGILALAVLLGTLFPSRVVPINVAGLRSDLPEALAIGLLAAFLVAMLVHGGVRRSAFTTPLVLVALAAAGGMLIGMAHGSDWQAVFGPAKTLAFYLLPLPLAAFLPTVGDLDWLEGWILRISTLGSIAVLGGVAAGVAIPAAESLDLGGADVTRLRPALVQLLLVATLLVLNRLIQRGTTAAAVAQLSLFLSVQALSYTRSRWIALVVCGALLIARRPGDRRPLRGVTTGVVTVAVAGSLVVLASAGLLGPTAKGVIVRAGSINASATQTKSLEDRGNENAAALATLSRTPAFGVGLGQPYGARRGTYTPAAGHVVFADRLFIQNSYLGIWLFLGVFGVAAFAAYGAAVMAAVRRARLSLSAPQAGRALAGGLVMLGFAIEATVQTKLFHRPSIVALCLGLAFVDVPRTSPATVEEAP